MIRISAFLMLLTLTQIHSNTRKNYYKTQDRLIVSRGIAKNIKNKQDAANLAINDAFQKALAKKIESIVTEDKYSLHYKLIDQNILNKASNFIKRFTIRRQTAENDILEVEIHLSIDDEKLKQALAANGLLFNESDYYKGLLMISIKSSKDSSPDFWWGRSKISSTNEKILRDIINQPELTKPIFKVDQFMLCLQDKIPRNLAKFHLNTEEIQAIGNIFGIDVIYYGSIISSLNTKKSKNDNVNLELSSSIKAINVTTGRIISNTNLSGNVNVLPSDIEKIEIDLISKITTKSLSKNTNDIVNTWINGTFNSTSYKVMLNGHMNYLDYNLFKDFLKRDIPSILSVEEYVISRNSKTLLIESNEQLNVIRDQIKNTSMENYKLDLEDTSEKNHTLKINLKRL